MTRHRFMGTVGQLCLALWPDANVSCALNYSASVHYNDDDHPFEAGEPACVWEMQNTPGLVEGNLYCWRGPEDAVHHHDDTAVTVVMQNPVPVNPLEAVMDKPLEDGMMWRVRGFDPTVPMPVAGSPWQQPPALPSPPQASAPAVDEESTFAAYCAGELRGGGEVMHGPWPVRQFAWGAGQTGAALRVMKALAGTGEGFTAHVWWEGKRCRIRVTWGSLLGVEWEHVASMVESWPT